ncbi:MAG TPA: hypothetical protein VG895_03030 [Patescibacteria group bacterium]|nr:hypothetical protein [Patescibacteria group bacterium]
MWKKISFIILLIGLGTVFHKFFLNGHLVFGDAPYFYNEGFKELLYFPSAWTSRGNALGNVNLFLWIYPLMFIYGALGHFLHFSNDVILRVLFYFPSLLFGGLGIYLLVRKYFKFSNLVCFYTILFYLINTYFLLLIDGGQVGVVLAYGLFPLVLFLILSSSFLVGLVAAFILTIVDFRIAAIVFLTALLLQEKKLAKIGKLILMALCLLGLSMYWIIPALRLSAEVSTDVASLQTTSFLNTLFLTSSNWPTNQFGQTIPVYFYFVIIPILVFLPVFLIKNKKIIFLTLCLMVFAFLAKGETPPFSFFYSFFVNNKFGSVFRDSTKFFIPLLLFGSILIGVAIEEISRRVNKYSFLVKALGFIIILFLVWQVVVGKMNGSLGRNIDIGDYEKIYNTLVAQNDFFRDAWFNEISPFSFSNNNNQALSASDLVNFRPFASMNNGTGDKFNFINNPLYLDFFRLFGIKYLVFNGNPRSRNLSETEQQDWDRLNNLIAADKRLKKLDIGTNIPVYENGSTLPNKFLVNQSFVVIGGDDIYQKLSLIDKDFSVSNEGFLFPEDGKFAVSSLENVASSAAVIIFNNKTVEDLKMSFLSDDFIPSSSSYYSTWAIRKASDYLMWKYEFLENNIDTHEFDYNLGVAFSTVKNEKLNFSLKVPADGSYYLAIRTMSGVDSSDLKLTFNHDEELVHRKESGDFEWQEYGPIPLRTGSYSLNLQNEGGFQAVNTIALISQAEMDNASNLSDKLLGNFQNYNIDKSKDVSSLQKILNLEKSQNYSGEITKPGWIIFTDTFNNNWYLQNGNDEQSVPMYSAVNGFYVDQNFKDFKITFRGDEYLRWGIYFSILTLLLIIIVYLFIIYMHERKNTRDN